MNPREKHLEQRVRQQEDIVEIINLKARYCDAADGGWDRASHNPERTAALFTEDGLWEAGGAGRAKGRRAIADLFTSFSVMHFAFHQAFAPEIYVNKDEATGRWHFQTLLNHEDQGPLAAAGVYRNRFVRTNEGWRFRELICEIAFMNPMDQGWSKV